MPSIGSPPPSQGAVRGSQWLEIAIRARACYEAASPALAAILREDFVQAYGRGLPSVVQCFADDFDACIAHLRFPLRHRKVIRTTNLLERLFLECHRFHDRADLEAQLAQWLAAVNTQRPSRATGVIPAVRLAEERGRLRARFMRVSTPTRRLSTGEQYAPRSDWASHRTSASCWSKSAWHGTDR